LSHRKKRGRHSNLDDKVREKIEVRGVKRDSFSQKGEAAKLRREKEKSRGEIFFRKKKKVGNLR